VRRRAVELGVTCIDTAESCGWFVAEGLIYEVLHSYPEDVVIATKAGLARAGPGDWRPVGPGPTRGGRGGPGRTGDWNRTAWGIAREVLQFPGSLRSGSVCGGGVMTNS